MKTRYIDIHAHTNFSAFDTDREEVIHRAAENSVSVINVGTRQDTSKKAVEMAEKYENLYAIVGLHPVHVNKSFHDVDELGEGAEKGFTSRGEDFDTEYYRSLVVNMETGEKHPKVVGIGECGLDFFHIEGDVEIYKNRQRDAFEKQIKLAIELDLPLMIHCRDAYPETIEILNKYNREASAVQNIKGGQGRLRGNFHFFAGTIEHMKQILDLDFTVSFTGVVTFAKQYEELVKFAPIDRIHAETDCPYVAPVPNRGKRNEPAFVVDTIKKIAEFKGVSLEEMAERLSQNSTVLFGI